MTKTDQIFLKNFALLVAGLAAFSGVLLVAAYYANERFYEGNVEQNAIAAERVAGRLAETAARIAPASQVFSGETGRQALVEAATAAAAAAKANVAYDGTLEGTVIYEKLCGACHNSGAGGAPLMQQAVWTPRIAQGMDTLVKHAIEGYQGQAGIMPARGGNPSLTDEQVTVTVQWMVDNLK